MKKNYGFTLIELLTVVAIVGIISISSATFISGAITNSTSRSMGNDLWLDIMYARNHAISSKDPITVTINPVDPTTGINVNWALGWTINASDIPASPIKTQPAFRNGTTISSTDPANILDKNNPITFTSDGISTTPGTLVTLSNGCAGENGREIKINQIGQVIITKLLCP